MHVMKDRTSAPVFTTKNPVKPQPGAPYTVIPPMKPFTVRETVPEGDVYDAPDGFQTAR
jgi:hypothetical protein